MAAGVTLVLTDENDGPTAEVQYTRNGETDVPTFLEGGTSKMAARPAVVPEYEKWREDAAPILAELMIQEMS